MQASTDGRPKVFLRSDRATSLFRELGHDTIEEMAEDLGVDDGNLSRILRGQPVSAEFIARVVLKYPKVPFEQLFQAAVA
jgi:transcriptional regulator with XRE-family HTH domain